MRSTKSRSRSKNNRNNNNNRSGANVVNRVFDSSGPEGKGRGTPQQIIDKYNQLTRDAQLSNDRVAAENFAQHAEHYTRMLGEAMKEQEARREQQERENQQRQKERDAERAERQEREAANAPQNNNASQGDGNEGGGRRNNNRGRRRDNDQSGGQQPSQNADRDQNRDQNQNRAPAPISDLSSGEVAPMPADAPQPDMLDLAGGETGLVETPESKPKPRKPRAPRKPKAKPEEAHEDAVVAKPEGDAAAAE